MSAARNANLARLKKQTRTSQSKAPQFNNLPCQDLNTEQRLTLFIKKMKENRAEIHRVNHQHWTDTLIKIALDKKLNTWLLGNNLSEIEQAGAALTSALSLIHI